MKKILSHIILLLSVSFLLYFAEGCRPTPIPLTIPKAQSKMAVASQVIPNSSMIIMLSRSFDALTPTDTNAGQSLLDQILVLHARVTISFNGTKDTLNRMAPGFYGSITTPLIEDVTYRLDVFDSTSGKSISAETKMMKRILIDTAFVSKEIQNKDTQRFLNLGFKDFAGEDYYMINIYKNTQFIKNTITNPVDVFNINNTDDVRTIPLSDQTFGGFLHTEKIDIPNFGNNDTLTVTLSHIDISYYTYLIQKERSAQNGLGNFFGEPVNYTTNVNNGYGFFTAYWPSSRIIIIKD